MSSQETTPHLSSVPRLFALEQYKTTWSHQTMAMYLIRYSVFSMLFLSWMLLSSPLSGKSSKQIKNVLGMKYSDTPIDKNLSCHIFQVNSVHEYLKIELPVCFFSFSGQWKCFPKPLARGELACQNLYWPRQMKCLRLSFQWKSIVLLPEEVLPFQSLKQHDQ